MVPSSKDKPLILVIDDNREFLEGVALTLEMEGFRVLKAAHGQQALDKLKYAFRGQGGKDVGLERLPDLILADIMTPVMDGYTFYEQVRANPYLNHIPFIFLSAKTEAMDIRLGKGLGADDYLTKPCSTEDLLAAIRGRLQRVEQQRALAAQLPVHPHKFPITNPLLFVVVIGLLLLVAFFLGTMLSWP
jgi:DNA-binding response OmpR family regulator